MLTMMCPKESDSLYSTMLKYVDEKSGTIMKETYLQKEVWPFNYRQFATCISYP